MNNDGLELIKKTIADLEAKRVQQPPTSDSPGCAKPIDAEFVRVSSRVTC